MINKQLSEELLHFFQSYLLFYKDFLLLETEKFEDMSHNNLRSLDERVKQEQAYLLKLKGFEIEREKLVGQAGDPKTTFRQLIPLFEEPYQKDIKAIYDELSNVLLDLREMNRRCNYLTEIKLHNIAADLNKIRNNPELQNVYNAKAQEGNTPPSVLSMKI